MRCRAIAQFVVFDDWQRDSVARGFPHEQLFQEDLKEKTTTYARNGIPEYWVIDLPHNKIWVFTQPNSQGYSQTQEFTRGNVFPLSFPDIAIAVNNLLLY